MNFDWELTLGLRDYDSIEAAVTSGQGYAPPNGFYRVILCIFCIGFVFNISMSLILTRVFLNFLSHFRFFV